MAITDNSRVRAALYCYIVLKRFIDRQYIVDFGTPQIYFNMFSLASERFS